MTPAYAQWLGRGRAHQKEQRPVDAMLCYRRAIRADSGAAEAHLHLGEVLWQLGRLPDAVAEWREAVRANPASLASHLALAEGTLATGDFGQAEQVAAHALARFADNPPLLLVRGVSRFAQLDATRQDADARATRAGDDVIGALTRHPDLLKVPSLMGPLCNAIDQLGRGHARSRLLRAIASMMGHDQDVVAVPALLLALIIEDTGNGGAAGDGAALFTKALGRPYGSAEHDALRRIAYVACQRRDASATALATRYAELCIQAFASSVPLMWPRRTAGASLRVLVVVGGGAARELMRRALAALSSTTRAACDVTIAMIGGDPREEVAAVDHFGGWHALMLPESSGLVEARQLAALDADVLLDLCGMAAPVGPLLAARPARAVVTLGEVAAPVLPPLVDTTLTLGALDAELAQRIHGLPGMNGQMPSAPEMTALFNDAVRLHQDRAQELALEGYARVLQYQPQHAQTLHLRGVLLRDRGDLEAALGDFTAALDVAPRYLDARVAAAQAGLDLGRADAAIDIARGHLADATGFKTLWRVLGLAHLARGEAAVATEVLEHTVRLDLTDGESHYNHGVALQTLRRFDDAARAYQRALAFRPDLSAADFNLGVLFQEQGNTDAAIAAYTQVLRDDPTHVTAYKNLGEVLFAAGRLDAWRANFARFEAQCPRALSLAVQALEVCQHFADFERLEHYLDGLRNERFTTDSSAELAQCLEELLYLLLFFDVEPEIVHRFSQTYDATAQVVYGTPMARPQERRPGRLRIGYLSADLRNHVMGKMMWEAVHRHDRAAFELFFYSLSSAEDDWTKRFRRLADHYEVLAHMPEKDAARRISGDDLDVLIDLSTHTRGAKPGILALKPARVQITHVASAGAVGLSSIDYKLTDQYADVPANQEHMIERLLVMQGCVYPYRHIPPAARHGYERGQLGIAADAFVIGAFVTPMKLSRRCLRLWNEVLTRLPHARLAMSPNSLALQAPFLHLAASAGIAPERLLLIPQGRDEHENQARYRVIDVVLDPMPFGGVNGTLEALDMGVPVVTLCGRRHGERTSYSILANLGVTDTVAMSGPEYVEIAVRLAQDAAFMQDVRAKIRAGLAHSPLTDMAGHTRHLEAAYRVALEAQSTKTTVDAAA